MGFRGCRRTYKYEHGEVRPPAAHRWDMSNDHRGGWEIKSPEVIPGRGSDPDKDPTQVQSNILPHSNAESRVGAAQWNFFYVRISCLKMFPHCRLASESVL